MSLSLTQLNQISAIERACSAFSLLGSVFTIVTFCTSKKFHKPINRLVFYASWGNMLTNVGTLMSRIYISAPNSVGCQLQAFLIQLFMPADAMWTLAMAVNVYLTFYHKFDAKSLRKMEIPYLCICYGVPLVPALTYIFVKNSEGARVYGNAVLWCWVSAEWGVWRVATFYGPVWVVIAVTFFIYIRAGRTIYQKRKQLRGFSGGASSDPDPQSVNRDFGDSIKTTEISVTTEAVEGPEAIHLQPVSGRHTVTEDGGTHVRSYSIAISANQQGPYEQQYGPNPTRAPAIKPATTPKQSTNRHRNQDINRASWAYTKCAILFFTALLITWIPSSANRVYSLVHAEAANAPLEYMSAFVLPLQGFWNAVIYAATSWSAVTSLATDWHLLPRPKVAEPNSVAALADRPQRRNVYRNISSPKQLKSFETESMTELARSQETSDDERSRH